ncbi:MAG: DNA gyrase subunit A [Patescibacteria group bacterium]|nr:DNA gyrase subunit A [Patescibacteria group bacterium]MDE2438407.1 DNA gyrase subunit A [Patescibacteria group bacterium]
MEEIHKEEKIQKQNITEELETSYIDYAMSVIVSRALPDVRDGLKPVHRRILYTMWDSGLIHTAKFKKCANVVGEVLGRYHPHGDSAVYDSLVRMAQDFSLRYPLVLGQGNFGSIDGDSAAAYRYTEAKLSAIAEEMLVDLDKETVDMHDNYDGSRKEPAVLPAKLPNLLLNGTSGIAVGMATNIPPHNLSEVSDAILHLADNPKATIEDLMQYIKGPDFPTGGIIYDKKAIREAYVTGRGPVTMRARADVEEKKGGRIEIVIQEIPYQVNKSDLIVKIAELVTDKRIEGIRDLRDESDREGLRIVIELKSDAQPQKILNQLYSMTDLQKNFPFNMVALVDGLQPQTFSLKGLLEHFLKHREIVVRRRAQYELRKAEERAHILEGLSKALDHIDEVIAIIKKSESKEDAKEHLMKKFGLTTIQTDAILEMKLQTLAGLERKKIHDELKEKRDLIAELKALLADPKKVLGVVKKEVQEIKEKFGDERRTKVVASPIGEFHEEDLIPEEEVVITMSSDGYIKRLPSATFKVQKRGGKGVIGFETKEDFVTHLFHAHSHDNILFFTSSGRVFQTKVYEIPAATRTSRGRSVFNFLDIPHDERVTAMLNYGGGGEEGPKYLVMVTKKGVIKKTDIAEFAQVRRSGIIAIKLDKNDELHWTSFSSGTNEIIIVTKSGQALRFPEKDVRAMGRAAQGVRAIRLKGADEVSDMSVVGDPKSQILVITEHGYGKRTPLKEYRKQKRGGSGIKTANVTKKTGFVIAARALVTTEVELIAITEKGQTLRTGVDSIRELGRATQGVRIMNVDSEDAIAGITIV